jgi:hypothetical protein
VWQVRCRQLSTGEKENRGEVHSPDSRWRRERGTRQRGRIARRAWLAVARTRRRWATVGRCVARRLGATGGPRKQCQHG